MIQVLNFTSFDFKDLDPQKAYYNLLAVIAPRPIAWVSTRSIEGVNNLAPFSFFNAFSADPPVVGFCPALKDDGTYKDTYVNLATTGNCVINMVSYELAAQMNLTATEIEGDEITYAGLNVIDSNFVKSPRILESPVQLEAKLLEIINFRKDQESKTKLIHWTADKAPESLEAGSAGLNTKASLGTGFDEPSSGSGNLIICELVCMHVREDLVSNGRIDTAALDLIGRNGASYYTRSNQDSMFELKRKA